MRTQFYRLIVVICLFHGATSLAQQNDRYIKWQRDATDSTLPGTIALSLLSTTTSSSKSAITPLQHQLSNHRFPQQQMHYDRLALASMTLVSLNYSVYQPFKQTWWEEPRTRFHLYRGWRRTRGYWDFGWHDTLYGHIDKLGHFYSAKLLSQQLYRISRWIGFDERTSKFIGPIMSSLLMLEIEIYDGFFKEWGFSLADFTANELGAFSPLIAEQVPFFADFQLKFSYHPSGFAGQGAGFIKDYPGMTYWLSYRLHSILPGKIKKYYPAWLNIALGYSVSRPARGKVELYLAPDIDWSRVPLGSSATAVFLKRTLNYFHFPGFSLKLTPTKKFYPIYF